MAEKIWSEKEVVFRFRSLRLNYFGTEEDRIIRILEAETLEFLDDCEAAFGIQLEIGEQEAICLVDIFMLILENLRAQSRLAA
jgi:hypothetical protein